MHWSKGIKYAQMGGTSPHNLRGSAVLKEDVKRYRQAWQDAVPGAGLGLPDYSDGGRPRWGAPYRYPGVAPFSHLAFPTVSDGRVYAQAPGQIRCLSFENGQALWSVREADLAPQRRFPTPGGPNNNTLRRSSMKRRVDNSATSWRSRAGWKSKSNCARVL